MHIWTIDNWKDFLDCSGNRRTGLRFRYEPNVDPEVKNACKCFAKWLRSEYYFPIRVPVYIKDKTYIKARDGEHVVGTFLGPYDYSVEPYIKIATGDYLELKDKYGRDNALATILTCIAHEITHYYQWINNLQLTDIGRERQATRYADIILAEYAMTREHP